MSALAARLEIVEPTVVMVDLPVPISVNRARRINWRMNKKFQDWTRTADHLVRVAMRREIDPLRLQSIKQFELTVIISEQHTRIDLDNGLKWLIDYLRRIELIEDDGPKHLRRLIVEWGHAPQGCRVLIRERQGLA